MSIDGRKLRRAEAEEAAAMQSQGISELELILASIPELKANPEDGTMLPLDYDPKTNTLLRYAFRLSGGIHYVKLEKFEIGSIIYSGKKEYKIEKRHTLEFIDGNLKIGVSANSKEAKKMRLKAFGWDQNVTEFVEKLDMVHGEQVNVYSSAVGDGLRFYVQSLRTSLAAKNGAPRPAPNGAYLQPTIG